MKIKNLLKSLLILSALLSSANAYEDLYYATGNFSIVKLSKVRGTKSSNDYSFAVGVGMNIMDNVRTDVSFEHVIGAKLTKDKKTIKAGIQNIMVNAYVDLFDFGYGRIFAGAGAGFSQVKARVSGDSLEANNGKAKRGNNLALAGYLGVSREFVPGIFGELKYGYKDFGKSRTLNSSDYEFRGHQITLGTRLEF